MRKLVFKNSILIYLCSFISVHVGFAMEEFEPAYFEETRRGCQKLIYDG